MRWQGRDVAAISGSVQSPVTREEDAEPLYLGYPHGPKTAEFVPPGRKRVTYEISSDRCRVLVKGGQSSFACGSESGGPIGGSVGRAIVPFANSVYDRAGDWLLSVKGKGVTVRPKGRSDFEITSDTPCQIVFRPHYYRDHLGYFLWDNSKLLRAGPIAGWCSWMAHLQDVKEQDVLDASQFFSKNLKDYGYRVIQIDDGYQRVKQFGQERKGSEPFSTYWTTPNDKFPHGIRWLAGKIKSLGLTPGIWVGYYLPLGLKHAEGYVTDSDGKPHKGPWVNYAMDGSVKAARDEGYIDTIREFKRQGWDYFKIDTLRHVLYDSYRQVPRYWRSKGESMEAAYRTIMAETVKAAGTSYVLACWGTIPELAGIPDGARIGEDVGPDFDSMRRSAKYIAQFGYLNDVVWRNDPDYMCLRVPVDLARSWASLAFLSGGHVMVSDPVSAYDADRVDVLRRVGPPVVTKPVSVVTHVPDPEFVMLSAEKSGERWQVVGRFAWTPLPPTSLDLRTGRSLVFDFWAEKFLGSAESIPFAALQPGSCQVLSVRPDLGRPQILGSNRHMGQGLVELDRVHWQNSILSGSFRRCAGRRWSLYIHVPPDWGVENVQPVGVSTEQSREVLKLTFPEGSEPMDFAIKFSR